MRVDNKLVYLTGSGGRGMGGMGRMKMNVRGGMRLTANLVYLSRMREEGGGSDSGERMKLMANWSISPEVLRWVLGRGGSDSREGIRFTTNWSISPKWGGRRSSQRGRKVG